MIQEITEYLSADHDRLDALLQHTITESDEIDQTAYIQFRQGLLRHIGIEEKILIPALKIDMNAIMKDTVERIHLDHSAIVALLVPPPSPEIISALHKILSRHNELEERNGGFYEQADAYDAQAVQHIADAVKNAPEVKTLPNNSNPVALDAARRALERAGYSPDEYLQAADRSGMDKEEQSDGENKF